MEFIGTWEQLHNHRYLGVEFARQWVSFIEGYAIEWTARTDCKNKRLETAERKSSTQTITSLIGPGSSPTQWTQADALCRKRTQTETTPYRFRSPAKNLLSGDAILAVTKWRTVLGNSWARTDYRNYLKQHRPQGDFSGHAQEQQRVRRLQWRPSSVPEGE